MAQMDKLICPTCGGSFFTTQRAEQFVAGGYGTAEFRSISNAPKTVLTCIGCSTPITPKPAFYGKGTIADIAEQDFRKSVELGQKHRKESDPKILLQQVASDEKVTEIKNLIDDVKKAVEAAAKPKAPVSKKEAKAATSEK